MSKEFKPIGNRVAVTSTIGKEKTTEAGIVYNEWVESHLYIWSEVVSVGKGVAEDIQINDMVYWKMGSNKGEYYEKDGIFWDLVNVDDIIAVDRNETD